MFDHIIRIFLAVSCIVLGISVTHRPRPLPPVQVSDNGIIPPDLLRTIAANHTVLDRPVEEIRLDHCGLETSIEQLEAASKTKIEVNWKALEAAGIDRAAPVTIHLHQTTVRQALKAIANNATGGLNRLSFKVDGDTIEVSTDEDLGHELVPEIYNIRPLIEQVRRRSSEFSIPSDPTQQEAVDTITKLLTDIVSPETWRDAGGTGGSIRELGGLLIVVQTPENHREIARLLTRLDIELRK